MRKNIIGFVVAAILLSLIGSSNVFATNWTNFYLYNQTKEKVKFVIVDSTNNTYWVDVESMGNDYAHMTGKVKTINFYSYGPECPLTIPFDKGEHFWLGCPKGDRGFNFERSGNLLRVW